VSECVCTCVSVCVGICRRNTTLTSSPTCELFVEPHLTCTLPADDRTLGKVLDGSSCGMPSSLHLLHESDRCQLQACLSVHRTGPMYSQGSLTKLHASSTCFRWQYALSPLVTDPSLSLSLYTCACRSIYNAYIYMFISPSS
jgi:hypothetical protein